MEVYIDDDLLQQMIEASDSGHDYSPGDSDCYDCDWSQLYH